MVRQDGWMNLPYITVLRFDRKLRGLCERVIIVMIEDGGFHG